MKNRVHIYLDDNILQMEKEIIDLCDKKGIPEPSRSKAIGVVYKQYLKVRLLSLRKNSL